jgi:hypothetical protein
VFCLKPKAAYAQGSRVNEIFACGIGLAEAAAANWRRRAVGKPAYFHHGGAENNRNVHGFRSLVSTTSPRLCASVVDFQ